MQFFLFLLFLFTAWAGYAQGVETKCQAPQPDKVMAKPCEREGKPRGVAGQFDYYSFVLSWSPAFCARAGKAHPFQCRDHQFGFVVHGLWPEKEDGKWPEYCATEHESLKADFVSQQMCRMPSAQLVQCEWKRHGACTGLDPNGYFETIAALHARITPPDLPLATIDRPRLLAAFSNRNPEINLEKDSVLLICEGANQKALLKEVRICLDKNFHPRACSQRPRNICPHDFALRP